MTPMESCRSAEARLEEARELMRPATIDQCLGALAQVIEIMEEIAAGNKRDWDPAVYLAFKRIRDAAGNLHRQIEHGSTLVRGWMQVRFAAGYTRGGLPEFEERESRSMFEA
jgi:hypothetical protein